jgi:hypothetical protein
MAEYIVQIEESEKNMEERFVGQLRSYPELIRCKDCTNHEPDTYCHIRDGLWYDNDYCSSAERKQEDK